MDWGSGREAGAEAKGKRERSASPRHEARGAGTIKEAGRGRAAEPRGAEGWGWGEVTPGRGPAARASLTGSWAGIAGPGLESGGPELGAARASLSPGAQQGALLRLGLASRLRRLQTAPSPMVGPRRLPPPGQRPPRPPGRLPPPPPRAMVRSHPGAQGGAGRPGRPTDPGPTDHSAATSLPRYGASEGQARPAHPRARPRGPRLQRARTRRAPPPPAPAGGRARRSAGEAAAPDREGRRKSARLFPGVGFPVRTGEGVVGQTHRGGAGSGPQGLTRAGRLGTWRLSDGSVINGLPGAGGGDAEQDP